jgi:hypothetical protein
MIGQDLVKDIEILTLRSFASHGSQAGNSDKGQPPHLGA